MARILTLPLLVIGLLVPGCISEPATPESSSKEAETALPVEPVLPTTKKEDFVLTASWATPVRAFNSGQPAELIKPGPNITGFIAEVVWTPSTPASAKMSVWIRKEGDGAVSADNPTFLINSPPPIKQADGASPIKVVLPAGLLKEGENYQVILRASAAPVGASVEQDATLYLTTFKDLPLDESFSAVPK